VGASTQQGVVVSSADPGEAGRFGVVAREIKESLHTKDWDEALIRCAERNLHYERAWRDLETGFGRTPDELTHRQIVALAGEFYCGMVVQHSDDPGRPIVWEQSLQDLVRRKRPLLGPTPSPSSWYSEQPRIIRRRIRGGNFSLMS
jgi:hypothetical protein